MSRKRVVGAVLLAGVSCACTVVLRIRVRTDQQLSSNPQESRLKTFIRPNRFLNGGEFENFTDKPPRRCR